MSPPAVSDAIGFHRELFVPPKVQKFFYKDADRLAGVLSLSDQYTSLLSLMDPNELKMDNNARTKQGGFRYTSSAFTQTAQTLASGLSKLLPDVSGMTGLADGKEHLVDGRVAIKFWNELVELRFSSFRRYRIIRNDDEGTIEGLVGHMHKYLGNLDLYREACESLSIYQPHVSMYAAMLVGRRFSVWFRADEPMFTLQVDGEPWPFYHGYYFTNGEATGTAVRGTHAIFSPVGACLAPYKRYGYRVTHTGRDFPQRVGHMFAEVGQADAPSEITQEKVEENLEKPLGIKAEWNKDQRREYKKKLVHSFGLIGATKNIAKEVVDTGLAAGRGQPEPVYTPSQANRLYSTRTLLDLYVPLLKLARGVDISRREKLEQAAFEILAGRFLL